MVMLRKAWSMSPCSDFAISCSGVPSKSNSPDEIIIARVHTASTSSKI